MANTKVTSGVIKDDAVGADQLASNAVVTASVVDNAITTAKIADANVLTAKISDSAITNAKMSANSVDSDQYVDGSIDTAHIGNAQVTSAKLETNVAVAGTLTVGSHLNMGDNDIIKLGANSDLQIYHDGSNSYIKDLGTGNLAINTNGSEIMLTGQNGSEYMIRAIQDGAVELYYNAVKKIATESGGVTVTGNITTTGEIIGGLFKVGSTTVIDGSRNLTNIGTIGSGAITSGSHLINASSSAFGSNSVQGFNTDFLVDTGQGYSRHNSYHTGGSNHQFIVNATSSTTNTVALAINKDANATFAGTVSSGAITTSGNLTASQSVLSIINNDIRLKTSGDETMLRAVANGAVELMHNNIPRVTTTATGVFLGNGTANTNFELDLKGVASKATRIQFKEGNTNRWLLGQGAASETTAFELFNAVGTIALSVSRSSSVATFAAGIAITAGDLVIPNSIVHAGDTDTKLDFNQADTMRLITGDTTAWICNGSSMVVNEDGVDRDFRVESDDNANMLFVDGNANKVGIGTNDLGAVLNIATADGTTNDVVNSIMITNKSTGTTTTGFGGEIRFQAQRNNGGIQNTGRIASVAEVNSGTTISSGLGLWTSVGGSLFERVRITNTGLLSIANNNNTHNFKANAGSSNSWFGVYDDGNDSANIEIRRSDTAQVFYVLGHTGNYHFAGSDVSDRDLKENIAYIPDGSLELVKQLKPRTYNFKSSEGFVNSSRTGFIAQEVADVMTTDHRVASGTDGDKDMGISPVGLIAHLTKAIQEQQTLIESLTARIETLEG